MCLIICILKQKDDYSVDRNSGNINNIMSDKNIVYVSLLLDLVRKNIESKYGATNYIYSGDYLGRIRETKNKVKKGSVLTNICVRIYL